MLTPVEAYRKAYAAWKRAANAEPPRSRRAQYQTEAKRNARISRLYAAMDSAREQLRIARAEDAGTKAAERLTSNQK